MAPYGWIGQKGTKPVHTTSVSLYNDWRCLKQDAAPQNGPLTYQASVDLFWRGSRDTRSTMDGKDPWKARRAGVLWTTGTLGAGGGSFSGTGSAGSRSADSWSKVNMSLAADPKGDASLIGDRKWQVWQG